MSDAIARWEALVQEKVDRGMPRHEATHKVATENPELRKQFVEAYNDPAEVARRRGVPIGHYLAR